jgi:ABC-type glycerol-3-phosphate transport system substrate-binding protein
VLKPNTLTIPTLVKGQTAAAAWELMKFIAGPTYQKQLIRDGLSLTDLKELVDYFHKNTPVRDPKVYTDALEKKEVTALPLFPKWNDFVAIVTEEMNKVRSGAVSLPAAVGSIKPRVNDLLKG